MINRKVRKREQSKQEQNLFANIRKKGSKKRPTKDINFYLFRDVRTNIQAYIQTYKKRKQLNTHDFHYKIESRLYDISPK